MGQTQTATNQPVSYGLDTLLNGGGYYRRSKQIALIFNTPIFRKHLAAINAKNEDVRNAIAAANAIGASVSKSDIMDTINATLGNDDGAILSESDICFATGTNLVYRGAKVISALENFTAYSSLNTDLSSIADTISNESLSGISFDGPDAQGSYAQASYESSVPNVPSSFLQAFTVSQFLITPAAAQTIGSAFDTARTSYNSTLSAIRSVAPSYVSQASSGMNALIGGQSVSVEKPSVDFSVQSTLSSAMSPSPLYYKSSVDVATSSHLIRGYSAAEIVTSIQDGTKSALEFIKTTVAPVTRGIRGAFSNRLEYSIAMAGLGMLNNMVNAIADTLKTSEAENVNNSRVMAQLEQDRKIKVEELKLQHANGYADLAKASASVASSVAIEKSKNQLGWGQLVSSFFTSYANQIMEIARGYSSLFGVFIEANNAISPALAAYLDHDVRARAAFWDYDYKIKNLNAQNYDMNLKRALYKSNAEISRLETMLKYNVTAAAMSSEAANADWLENMKFINAFREIIAAYAAAPVPSLINRPTPFGTLLNSISGVVGVAAQVAQIAAIL